MMEFLSNEIREYFSKLMDEEQTASSPEEQEINEIQKDIDSIPKCKECHELIWCDGDCCFDSPKEQREDFFKQQASAIRNATLDVIIEFTKGNSETIESDDGTLEDAVFLGELLAKLESLRTQEHP